jgi:sporulation protein YlmC with PRC-barrel domain
MNKLALSALAATAMMTLPALAQAPANNPPAANPGAAMTLQQNQVSNLWRASKLDGVNIYNNNNEKIGEIGDVLIDHNGKAMAVVVDVGGFLGMGEHRVALKFEDVKFSDAPMSNSTASRAGTNAANTATTTTGAAVDRNAPAGAPPSTVSTANSDRANAANNNRMYPDHAVLNMTKDQLKALPQISYSR